MCTATTLNTWSRTCCGRLHGERIVAPSRCRVATISLSGLPCRKTYLVFSYDKNRGFGGANGDDSSSTLYGVADSEE